MNLLSTIRRNLQSTWHVGIVKNSLDEVFAGVQLEVQWIKPVEKDCWYSDPFILDVTESEYIILVEQYNIIQGKGVITRLIVDKDTAQVKSRKIVLELLTHLSFPAIFRIGGDVFIHPENSEAYSHDLYKYNRQTNKFDFYCNICRGQITDASFLDIDGDSYMFCTKEPDSYGKTLYIYRRAKERYKEQGKIEFNEYIARMGGNFFRYKEKWIRPAQICNNSYGEGIVLQEVERRPQYQFTFRDIRRIYPSGNAYSCGLHTFNVYKESIIIDGKTYNWKFLRKFIDKVRIPLQRQSKDHYTATNGKEKIN